MEQQEFDDIWGSCDLPDFERYFVEPNNSNCGFTESESSTLDPTKLDKNQGQFSEEVAESDVNSFANHDLDFPPINNGKQATPDNHSNHTRRLAPYTYDKFGQLEGNAGFGKEVIEQPDFGQFFVEPNNLNCGFTESESFTLDPTKLDKNQGQFSEEVAESDVNSFVNHDLDFPPINNGKQATPDNHSNHTRQGAHYTYDKFGQLEGNAGFGKEVIEHYLCKHHFYGERINLKNCGLTLWIQRAPPNNDSYGPTPALCLYKDCHVDQNRHIQPGDIRIAFDEKTARGLERDPRVNAGYVHLKCLEAHIPYHRQMFAKLNFKVEGRGPHKNDPWQNNPTMFTTLSQIVYAEEYIEGCSKESWNGGKYSDAILLSAGIEKQLRAEHPLVREVISKIIEMEGWYDLKALVDKKYSQALSRKLPGNKIERPLQPRSKPKGANGTSREAYRKKKKDHGGRDERRAAKKVNRRARRRNRYEYTHIKEGRIKSSKHSKKHSKKRESSPEEIELEVATEPQPLKRGEGKIKSRLFIKDGKEVWEDYEDPWSPLVSDIEEGTEDDDEWSGDEDSEDDEALIDDEPRGRKRMRSDDEDDSEYDEPRGRKRKRSDDEDDSEEDEPRNPKRKRRINQRA